MNTTLLETGDNSWCHFRSMERERKEGGTGGGHAAWVSWVNEAGGEIHRWEEKKQVYTF